MHSNPLTAPLLVSAFVLLIGIGFEIARLIDSVRHGRTVEFFCTEGVVKWRQKN